MLNEKVEIIKKNLGEEITNALLSGIGSLLGIAIIVMCVIKGAVLSDAMYIVFGSLWGAGVFMLFIMNVLYHSFRYGNAKRVFLILSTCMLHFAIFSFNAFLALSFVGGALGWVMFGISLALATVSIIFCSINLSKFISFSFAILNLWLMMINFNSLVASLNLEGFVLYAISLNLCTLASLFYILGKRFENMHIMFHIFVLMGIAASFFAVYLYV